MRSQGKVFNLSGNNLALAADLGDLDPATKRLDLSDCWEKGACIIKTSESTLVDEGLVA